MEYPVLKVPSAIIPVEYNYLINPKHPDLQLQTEQVLEFQFDSRMWKQGTPDQ
jgi:RES domain-containing protein